MIYKIKNSQLEAMVDSLGAQLISLKREGKEYIWQRDEKYWDMSAPVLFPMVSSFLDNKFTHKGETYNFVMHGFAQDCDYELLEKTENKLTLRLIQNRLTKRIYPFEYDFTVSFELKEEKIDINYNVKNLSQTENMYFNTGSHEGYILFDGGTADDYYIEFDEKEKLTRMVVSDPVWRNETEDYGEGYTFDLAEEQFAVDGVFFINIKSESVTLKSKKSHNEIKVNFDGDALGLWKVPGAPYICIEPWDGFCPFEGDGYELSEKRFIKVLKPNSEYTFNHSIEIRPE